jgi:integral membrane sensor domain MASE1
LKMKKHKFKKLLRKTRTLRRKLDKAWLTMYLAHYPLFPFVYFPLVLWVLS